jgi:hypothetical protein
MMTLQSINKPFEPLIKKNISPMLAYKMRTLPDYMDGVPGTEAQAGYALSNTSLYDIKVNLRSC